MNLVIVIIQIILLLQKIKLHFFSPKDTFSLPLIPSFFFNILKFSLNSLIFICIIYIGWIQFYFLNRHRHLNNLIK